MEGKRMKRGKRGSPAWAGIDPDPNPAEIAKAGFPRVGGDRPYVTITEAADGEVPPRGRG